MGKTGPSPYDLVHCGSYIGFSGAEDKVFEEAPAALRAAARWLEASGLRSRRFTVAMRTLLFPAKGRRASRQTPIRMDAGLRLFPSSEGLVSGG